eukprot:TRINITY_DN61035_c0_g1_i1.p1 TRINITY_DN61035_c0_g1~~TRINITY_DN61035_c0_g1_i1.p1  ORF type:complete len:319 (+),score=35.34 TRINITY_DN61035_c0_g1_i1:38-994(+)
MKFSAAFCGSLVTVAWSYKTNASETALWQNAVAETPQCTCQMDSGVGSSMFTYISSLFTSRSNSQASCLSEDDITEELKFGWNAPDNVGCHTGFYRKGNKMLQKCLPAKTNGPAMYLVGDSHAYVSQRGLKKASTIEVYHASWQCINDVHQHTDVFPDHLRQVTKANDIIVFVSMGASYKDHALKLIALAQEKKLKLVLLGDYPTLPQSPALCFHASKPGADTNCKVSKTAWETTSPRKENKEFAQRAARENPGTVFFHDLAAAICPGTVCDMWVPGTKHPAYMDQYHINKAGSSYLSQSFCTFLNGNGLYVGGLPGR